MQWEVLSDLEKINSERGSGTWGELQFSTRQSVTVGLMEGDI